MSVDYSVPEHQKQLLTQNHKTWLHTDTLTHINLTIPSTLSTFRGEMETFALELHPEFMNSLHQRVTYIDMKYTI